MEVFVCKTGLSGGLEQLKDCVEFAQIVGTAGPTTGIPTVL